MLPIRHHLRGKFILNQDARRNVRLSVFAQIHPLPSVPVTTLPKTNNVYPKSWFGKGGTPLYQICPFFGIYESMFDFRVCVKDDTPPPPPLAKKSMAWSLHQSRRRSPSACWRYDLPHPGGAEEKSGGVHVGGGASHRKFPFERGGARVGNVSSIKNLYLLKEPSKTTKQTNRWIGEDKSTYSGELLV